MVPVPNFLVKSHHKLKPTPFSDLTVVLREVVPYD